MLICIDPGHSVDTAGKCSPDGSYYEHEFNLDVGFKLKAELERCGFDVIMTRETLGEKGPWTTDAQKLAGRCKIANDARADYFISIHTDAAGNGGWYDAHGLGTFIIARGGQAERLAGAIQREAVQLLGCADRGTQVKNLAVVRDTKMPAVLVEYGFHTHRAEVEKLKTQEYRQLCAEATARAVCGHTGRDYVPATEKPTEGGKTVTVAELKAMGYTSIEL